MLIQVIFFRGDTHADLPLARELMLEHRTRGIKSAIRLAPVFMGDVEECERVVLLPLVHPSNAARITKAYEAAGIPVERYTNGGEAPAEQSAILTEATTEDQPVIKREPLPADAMLRRLTNRQLRDLANERSITRDETLDRASLIAAIVAAKEPPP